MFTSFGAPVERETMRRQRLDYHTLPEYRPKRGRENGWGFDVGNQAKTYTGLGMDVNAHDQWAVESPGRIHDRTQEHLGASDVGIVKYRKLLLAAIRAVQDSARAPFSRDAGQMSGPVAIDAIGADGGCWEQSDRERREKCSWARQQESR
jgi:hypothetical protein